MATNKPRLTLSLSPELYSELARYAALQKRPMSASLVDWLEHLRPTLAQISDSMEFAARAKQNTIEGLEMTSREMGAALAASTQALEFVKKLKGNAKDEHRRLGRSAVVRGGLRALQEELATAQPPHSNTGVRNSVDDDGIPC